MKDKRYYRRLRLQNIPILLYTTDNDEITAEIHDISEEGIGIHIDKNIDLDDKIKFTICDTIKLGKSNRLYLVNGYCQLKHKEQHKNGSISFGGRVIDSYYHDYYLAKELQLLGYGG